MPFSDCLEHISPRRYSPFSLEVALKPPKVDRFGPQVLGSMQDPKFLQQFVSAIYAIPCGKVLLSSVCWPLCAKPDNEAECRIYDFYFANKVNVPNSMHANSIAILTLASVRWCRSVGWFLGWLGENFSKRWFCGTSFPRSSIADVISRCVLDAWLLLLLLGRCGWLPDKLCRRNLGGCRVWGVDIVDAEGQGECPRVGVVAHFHARRCRHRHRSGRRHAVFRPPRPLRRASGEDAARRGLSGGGAGCDGGRWRTNIGTDWVSRRQVDGLAVLLLHRVSPSRHLWSIYSRWRRCVRSLWNCSADTGFHCAPEIFASHVKSHSRSSQRRMLTSEPTDFQSLKWNTAINV